MPEHLRSDNGPEFIASCIQDWLKAQAIKTLDIKPGSPWENGHIESFHDKLRDECLNRELFGNLQEARVILESWRVEYNERRLHSALGYQTPNEYAGRKTNRSDGGYAPPNPTPLAAAGVRGELTSNATKETQ
ncbi:MAG TPA: integrase core domain-containing protein, partial [Terrimicrobiaceae bacterium]